MSTALAAASTTARTITCQTCTAPVQVSAARTKAWIIITTWAMTMIDRLGKRSAMEPLHNAMGTSGITPIRLMVPSIVAEPVSRQTSHCWAMVCIQVPMSEMSWPKKKSR